MKILISNDDGVHAKGINVLYEYLKKSYDICMIAPLEERSTTGHSLSLDRPLRVEQIGDNIYGCSGYPGDCILIGLGNVLKDSRPQLIISGINKGANLSQDLYYSGTVAAAREGSFHQVPAISVSLCFNKVNTYHYYESAAQVIFWLVKYGIHEYIPPLYLFNVNVPNLSVDNLKGIKLTHLGFRHYSEEVFERVDSRGRPYYWIAGHYQGHTPLSSSDCQAVDEGWVSLTPHNLMEGKIVDWSKLKEKLDEINKLHFNH